MRCYLIVGCFVYRCSDCLSLVRGELASVDRRCKLVVFVSVRDVWVLIAFIRSSSISIAAFFCLV